METHHYKTGDQINLEQAMRFALELSKKGRGLVEPNPCVGAVLVDEAKSELISFGFHEKFGEVHAEVNCLNGRESARGLTLIVTLEPCSHFGKTPPCAELVIKVQPKKLIYMNLDPNPLVSGKGLKMIQEAGIEVEKAPEKFGKKDRLINHKFYYAFENKEAYVHLKWAESLDGFTKVLKGPPQITSKEAQMKGHFLRAQSQAVLIGRGTLEADNPSLNVRLKGYEKPLLAVVFDPKLKLLPVLLDRQITKVRDPRNVIVLCESLPLEKQPFSFLKLHKNTDGEWSLKQLRKDLFEKFKIQSLYVEGGAHTLNAFIKQREYNRISIFKSNKNLSENGAFEVIKSDIDFAAAHKETTHVGEDQFSDYLF